MFECEFGMCSIRKLEANNLTCAISEDVFHTLNESTNDLVTFVTIDGKYFHVAKLVARCFGVIAQMLDIIQNESLIPVQVHSEFFQKALAWASHYLGHPPRTRTFNDIYELCARDNMCMFDLKVLTNKIGVHLQLIHTAKYLQMDDLHEAACHILAHSLCRRTPMEISELLESDNIEAKENSQHIVEAMLAKQN